VDQDESGFGLARSANDLKEAESYLSRCEDASEAWEGRGIRRVVRNATSDWIVTLAPWRILLTLTFREETPVDVAWHHFYALVRRLNVALLGRHYTKKVRHSYFAYVVGIERQTRGVVHLHALVDRPVDFALIHREWQARAGFAHTEMIRNTSEAVRYVSKYALKGGDIWPFVPERNWEPEPLPYWWKEIDAMSGALREAGS
jgi:hypothetical protein